MANRIEELFQELAENVGNQQQFQIDQQLRQQEAERELYDTDEARRALKIIGGLLTLGIPFPGMRARGVGQVASQVPGVNKLYGQVGQDFTKFIDPLKSKLSGVFGQSGARVGTDVAGRVPLPKIKDPVVTKQGHAVPLILIRLWVRLDPHPPKELETQVVFPMRKGHSYLVEAFHPPPQEKARSPIWTLCVKLNSPNNKPTVVILYNRRYSN